MGSIEVSSCSGIAVGVFITNYLYPSPHNYLAHSRIIYLRYVTLHTYNYG